MEKRDFSTGRIENVDRRKRWVGQDPAIPVVRKEFKYRERKLKKRDWDMVF